MVPTIREQILFSLSSDACLDVVESYAHQRGSVPWEPAHGFERSPAMGCVRASLVTELMEPLDARTPVRH
jgi:hypothetical protein